MPGGGRGRARTLQEARKGRNDCTAARLKKKKKKRLDMLMLNVSNTDSEENEKRTIVWPTLDCRLYKNNTTLYPADKRGLVNVLRNFSG